MITVIAAVVSSRGDRHPEVCPCEHQWSEHGPGGCLHTDRIILEAPSRALRLCICRATS